MTDELMFVFGPVIVGVAAVAWGTVSPVVGAAILTAVGITAFALHGSAQYAQGRTDPRPRTRRGHPAVEVAPASLLFRPVVLLPVGGMVAIGLFFGSTLTSLTAYMETLGQADATGILYGVMGVGSAVRALSVVALPEAFSLRARWLVFSLLMLAGCLLYPQGQTLTFFVIALLIMGSGVGPSLVTLFAIASQHAPAGRLTTVMAMMSTGVVVGQSAASALSGAVLDGAGLAVGLWGPAASAALLVALGLAYMWSAQRTRRSRTEVS